MHKIKVEKENSKSRKVWKPKIRAGKLKDLETKQAFQQDVVSKYENTVGGSVDEKWKNIKSIVLECEESVCGKTKGCRREKKETWWWNENVQGKLKMKKKAFKEWQTSGDGQTKEKYKKGKKEAKKEEKKVIAKARWSAGNEFYANLDTKEGEANI